jgi:queuine tRNA-ribosyltransferase
MDTQRTIGADIMMAFDECTPWPCEIKYATDSMHRTHRWLDRCFDRFNSTEPKYGHEQALFPIVQGSTFAGTAEGQFGIHREERCVRQRHRRPQRG